MNDKKYQWAVVGAGPAGIAALGKLLDYGITPADILWLDPAFNVGDLGRLWKNVSSNTKVGLFIHFLNAVKAFSYQNAPDDFQLNHLLPDETCPLHYVVEPLQWVSDQLRSIVHADETLIQSMSLSARHWTLNSASTVYYAQNVILATGAVPTQLNYPDSQTIPFEVAIDKTRLIEAIKPDETYAVFGSSHSAIIIINHLVSLGAKKIINFYRSPCRYAVDMGDWILFDNTGLKGQTAEWARQYIDGVLPANLVRYNSNESNVARYLPECNKAIYATGFTQRNSIAVSDYVHHDYNPHVGIIGPGLFGVGIAYPEVKPDPFGSIETQVGLWKFMTYLNKVMPVWFKYST